MKKRIILVLLSLLFLLTASVIRFTRYYGNACEDYITVGIKGELSYKVNLAVAGSLNDNNGLYGELADITYLPDGRISTININAVKLNLIAVDIANIVYESVRDSENDYGIPLGNAFGSRLLSGKGPKIGVRVLPISAVSYEIKSDFISGGINQTVHRISIRYTVTVKCLAPFDESIQIIEGETVLAETVIVGEVPNVLFSGAGSLSELSGTFE